MRSTRPSRHGSPWTGLQHEQAVEGKEILLGYNEVVSGLQKNGEGLTTAEVEALMGALESVAINPSFVQRLLREHGGQALALAFGSGKTWYLVSKSQFSNMEVATATAADSCQLQMPKPGPVPPEEVHRLPGGVMNVGNCAQSMISGPAVASPISAFRFLYFRFSHSHHVQATPCPLSGVFPSFLLAQP